MPGEIDQRLREQGLHATGWGNGPGERYAAHEHPYDKVIAVERGSIRFGLPDSHDSVQLEVGDRLDLPAGTIHDAVVGPSGVACLEAHLSAGTFECPLRRPSGSW